MAQTEVGREDDDGLTIIVVASLTRSLINFRRNLLEEIAGSGPHTVIACGPEEDPEVEIALARMGVGFRRIPMDRASTNPISDLRTLISLWRLFRRENADVVLAYTQKPIIYSGLAVRTLPRVAYFAMQSGLGFTFSEENKSGLLRRAVALLYRAALKKARVLFVFNKDDEADMRRFGMLQRDQKIVRVPGSGIDKTRFAQAPVPSGPPVFLIVARLMRDKGHYEFVEAARAVKAAAPDARFQVLGPFDANPASIAAEDLESWKQEGVVEYLGETKDVRPYLAAASVFVLPSYHREGLPRSILEALSVGRAVVTTDMPGCRETVIEGENGYITPPRDAAALAAAMQRFTDDPGLAARMGERSRRLVDETFDVRLVNDRVLTAMGLRGVDGAPAPLLTATREPTGEGVRRGVERAIGLVGFVVTLPFQLAIGAAIYFTMGGPALFRQTRAGVGGSTFQLVKFRTMTNERGADGELLPDEDRITPLGRFLRRSRLDELPELWNIARGQMAIVGPRPLLPTSPPNLGEAGAERLSTPPGLTGWAQVNGNTLLSDDEKLSLDLWYVRNRSLWLDLKIILKTIGVVIFGERLNRARLETAHGVVDRRVS